MRHLRKQVPRKGDGRMARGREIPKKGGGHEERRGGWERGSFLHYLETRRIKSRKSACRFLFLSSSPLALSLSPHQQRRDGLICTSWRNCRMKLLACKETRAPLVYIQTLSNGAGEEKIRHRRGKTRVVNRPVLQREAVRRRAVPSPAPQGSVLILIP